MKILSLFDGISGAQQALTRAKIQYTTYHASEVDKHAIKVTQTNYPDTVQLGDVRNVTVSEHYDMLFGGSPCQSFSFAGKQKGMSTTCEKKILSLDQYLALKGEGFEFEGQSYLFWEYIRILGECRKINPDIKFLLENVIMAKEWESVISKAVGVNPIEINSALVSAQNRRRLYWTNIGMRPAGLFGDLESIIQQPKDKGILLRDILEENVDEKYYLSQQRIKTIEKSKRSVPNIDVNTEKHGCLIANYAKIPTDGQYIVHNMMPRSSTNANGGTGHLTRTDGKTYCLDTGRTNAVEVCYNKRLNETLNRNTLTENCMIDSYNKTVHIDKSITISTRVNATGQTHIYKNSRIRRLTPVECERLQTVSDGFTSCVSETQRYRSLGNGWTIDVIVHILSYL